MLPVKCYWLAAPQAVDDLQRFVEQLRSYFPIDGSAEAHVTSRKILLIGGPEPDRDNQAPIREQIECGGIAGEEPGLSPWQRMQNGTDTDALGLCSHCCKGDPG